MGRPMQVADYSSNKHQNSSENQLIYKSGSPLHTTIQTIGSPHSDFEAILINLQSCLLAFSAENVQEPHGIAALTDIFQCLV